MITVSSSPKGAVVFVHYSAIESSGYPPQGGVVVHA
jgi:hypothetical protein